MRNIKIEKITLNVGAGKDQAKLEKGLKLIKHITGMDAIKTKTNKRIPAWGLRIGLPIGCKLTIRNPALIKDLLTKMLQAKNSVLKKSQFDSNGNIAFGIHEYIDMPEIKYNPDVGIMGFEVCVTLRRDGYRIKKRRMMKRKIPEKHKIKKDEAVEFMKNEFQLKIEEE